MPTMTLDQNLIIPNPAPKRIKALPALTGIRGVAAMSVFLCHMQPIALKLFGFQSGSGSLIIGSGFRGVDLFFILSGFILYHVHSGHFKSADTSQIWQFYLLRFFRVYPLNAMLLLLMVPLPVVLPKFVEWYRLSHLAQGSYHLDDFSAAAFVQSFFLAQEWTVVKLGTWNEPAWTLSAEVVGYCFFPFLAMAASRQTSGLPAMLFAAGSLGMFVLLMVAGGHATNNPSGVFGLVRMTLCFTAGIGLCRTFQLWSIRPEIIGATTIASVILICATFWWVRMGTASVFGFAGLIFGLAYERGPIHRLMATLPIVFLGRISFSFYLVHLMALELFDYFVLDEIGHDTIATKAMALAAVITAVFLLAVLAYRGIEVPCQRLGRIAATRLPTRRAMHGIAT